MHLARGMRLGPYEIVAPLGAGGMGEVYRASDPRLGREVALKVLPAELYRDESVRVRFELEARAASALNHPNIVSIHDIGQDNGVSYIVTELVDGESLRQVIAQGRMPARRLIDVAQQIADGLAAAHAAGVVHRDLKPENILITRDGRVKIIDFGLAKQLFSGGAGPSVSAQTLTMPGAVMGTIGYMSPEQIRAQSVDQRTDIFSLGVILHEMAAGESTFPGASAPDVMSAILREDPPPLQSADLPPGLSLIVDRCLTKDPVNRFQTASDLAFAIRNLSGIAVHAQPTAAKGGRRSLRWLAWAVPGLCIAAGGAYWVLRPNPSVPLAGAVNKEVPKETTAAPAPTPAAPPAAPHPQEKKAKAEPTTQAQQTAARAPVQPAPASAAASEPETQEPNAAPDSPLARAQQLMRNGKYADAKEVFSNLLRTAPNSPFALLGRGRASAQLRQSDSAMQDFDQLIRLRPGMAVACVDRGHVYNHQGQYRRAIQDFDEAIRLNAQLPGAYEGRAQAKMSLGDRRGAREDRREAARVRGKQ
jgi:tRNA A-37 threonylcarbamoyl transferase component Bud32/Flp pilus assembly protein TadD